MGMTAEDVEMYWRSITAIEAQEALMAITIQMFEHRKKPDRERLHRSLHRKAYPFEKNYLSVQDAMESVNGN